MKVWRDKMKPQKARALPMPEIPRNDAPRERTVGMTFPVHREDRKGYHAAFFLFQERLSPGGHIHYSGGRFSLLMRMGFGEIAGFRIRFLKDSFL